MKKYMSENTESENWTTRRLVGALLVGTLALGVAVFNAEANERFTPESVAKVTEEKCLAHADRVLEGASASLQAEEDAFNKEQANLVRMFAFSQCMAKDYHDGHELMRYLMQKEIDKEMGNLPEEELI